MLILTRRIGERVIINGGTPDEVSIQIMEATNGKELGRQVRLGIDAPKHIVVDREEIAIKRAEGFPDEKSIH